jgi:hypothetical protein
VRATRDFGIQSLSKLSSCAGTNAVYSSAVACACTIPIDFHLDAPANVRFIRDEPLPLQGTAFGVAVLALYRRSKDANDEDSAHTRSSQPSLSASGVPVPNCTCRLGATSNVRPSLALDASGKNSS